MMHLGFDKGESGPEQSATEINNNGLFVKGGTTQLRNLIDCDLVIVHFT